MKKISYFSALFLIPFFAGITFNATGQNQNYLDFDGNNDYVKYADDATLGLVDGATDYTIEAWVYPVDGRVAEYDRVLQRYYSFAIVMYDGNDDGNVEDWYFQVYDKGSSSWKYYNTQGDATLTLNAWNHVAVINDATAGTLKLYVNGVDVTTSGGYSNRNMPSSSSNDNLYIGQKGNGASYFGGYLDEIRIKNTAENISNLHYHKYDNQYETDNNTAALFHFNEGSGTNTTNEASSSNAVLHNGAIWRSWDYSSGNHLPLAYEWLGTSTTDWATASNWGSSSVPGTSNDVLIPDQLNDPVIGNSTAATVRNILMENSSSLTVNSGGSLEIKGLFTNNGTYTDNGSIKFSGTSAQTIPAGTYNDLEVDNSAGLTLGGAVSINGTLTLTNGIINTTSTNLLTFTSTATAVSGGSNTAHVDGPMAKVGNTNFIFPCGDGGKWARLGISDISASETFTVEYHKATPADNTTFSAPLTKVSYNEWWQIDRAGSATASVTMYWQDSQWSAIGNFDDLRIAHYNGSTWEAETGTYSHTGSVDLNSAQIGSIKVTGVSSFSPFSFGTTDNTTNPLPVELLDFSLKALDGQVNLNWQTASEINNRGFEIQRSSDGKSWEKLGEVKGAGSSNVLHLYSFIDKNPQTHNYYRLKQTDYDGSYVFSQVKYIDLANESSVILYPNPAKSSLLITGIESFKIKQSVVYNVAGAQVLSSGSGINKLDVSSLRQGIYFVRVLLTDRQVIEKQIFKQ